MQWQKIETAPRDGTKILGYGSEEHEIVEWMDACEDSIDQPGHDAGWFGCFAFPGRSIKDRYFTEPQGQPTHWMPLPDIPPLNETEI